MHVSVGIRHFVTDGPCMEAAVMQGIFLKRWTPNSIIFRFSNFPLFSLFGHLPIYKDALCCGWSFCWKYGSVWQWYLRKEEQVKTRYAWVSNKMQINCWRDAEKISEGFTSKSSWQLETRFDHLEYLAFRSVQGKRDMNDGVRLQISESGEKEEAPSCIWYLIECLLTLCSSSSA